AALKNLDDLEQTRQQRDELRAQSAKIDAETVNVKAERKRLEHRINDIRAAKEEIARLQLKAAEQLAIEKEIDTFRNGIAAARTADERILSINA
ncbi:MAG: hypothetical protein ABIV48_10350, partial [Pyrinomonadaceae bacterium]